MLARLFGAGNTQFGAIRMEQHLPPAATAATKTISAVDKKRHILHKVWWSYSEAPTGGRLTISGGLKSIDIDITNSGPGPLSPDYVCEINTDLIVNLASGGGTCTGKLTFSYSTVAEG